MWELTIGVVSHAIFVVLCSEETREHWDCNHEIRISISALVAEILRFEVLGVTMETV